MQTINLNSNLLPIIDVGMYETFLDPRYMFDDYQINEDKDEGYIEYTADQFWDGFDNKAYVRHIQELAHDYINGTYEGAGMKVIITAGEIYSPRYYNYETDQIELTVEYNKGLLARYIIDNATNFEDFLKEHYSSRDGFISWTADNFMEWMELFNEDKVHEVGAALRFWFESEIDMQGWNLGTFTEFVHENTYYSEFYNEQDNV